MMFANSIGTLLSLRSLDGLPHSTGVIADLPYALPFPSDDTSHEGHGDIYPLLKGGGVGPCTHQAEKNLRFPEILGNLGHNNLRFPEILGNLGHNNLRFPEILGNLGHNNLRFPEILGNLGHSETFFLKGF